MKSEISLSTIRRLPIYLHYLKSLDVTQLNISATQIAGALNLGEVQVRKDLASISCGGKPKVGYEIKKLISELESYLGANDENSAVIVGVGRLGQALLEYHGFEQFGLEIVAGFDVRNELFGKTIGGKPIFDEKQISNYVNENGITMAIITVPALYAQATADKLISAGVKAIWNFSPTHIVVPDSVVVKNENLAASLAVLSKQLREKTKFDFD